ncbi:MAG: YcgN family cysteine cluster protein [Pseudomonadota bacterium]
MPEQPWWEKKPLGAMNPQEWESLCDGCARCCLHKLEDADTGEVHYTDVVCRYLDKACRCTEYPRRNKLVPDCVVLNPDLVSSFHWLPDTCAYRLLAEGKPLFDWHPLVSGNPGSVRDAGIAVTRWPIISDAHVHPDDFEDRIIRWVEQ